ncbi:MAG: hypothetical protein ABL964_07045 [Steroidobacteraceae bacterium]
MPGAESSRHPGKPGTCIALLGGCFAMVLAGCAAPSVERQPGAPRVGDVSCSLRALVTLRQGSSIRSDSDLAEIGRRLGVNMSVLQSMGRNSKLIVIRENGPEAACEDSFAELRNDLRIESIERY